MTGTADPADLDGWPTLALGATDIREVAADEFVGRLIHPDRAPAVFRVQTAPGGSAQARVATGTGSGSGASRTVLNAYLKNNRFEWAPEFLYLINEPCYIVVATGVIILGDGRIVRDSLFPSWFPPSMLVGDDRMITLRVAGGLTAENIAEQLRAAPEFDGGVWAPLLSRWSNVYGHAVSESLVQDSAIHRAGLSPLVRYAAPPQPQSAQKVVFAQAHSHIETSPWSVVKVPRVLFASALYTPMPLGTEFRESVARTRARIRPNSARPQRHDRIYVSRLDVPSRRLANEAELIGHLEQAGFHIVAGERLSFEEQVRAFQDARLIVGPYGSGLVNSAFAAPGATLCELRPLNSPGHNPLWDHYFFALAATMQFTYAAYVADNPPDADTWTCDIQEVLAFIDALSAGQASEGSPMRDPDAAHAVAPVKPVAEVGSPSSFWTIPEHTGDDYYTVLWRLHQHLQPRTYLEIGTMQGMSLALASCASIAIDPQLDIGQPAIGSKPSCLLFQMKSDAFFAAHDPKILLGGAVDMGLLDGTHLFEFVLRDFINIEKHVKRNSIILLHDCIPTDAHIARRLADNQAFARESQHPDWWAGDVWKLVVALKRFRPDLVIHAFNAPPTGLVAITNLDPASGLLADRYFEAVAQYRSLELGQYGIDKYLEDANVLDTAALASFEAVAELFWL